MKVGNKVKVIAEKTSGHALKIGSEGTIINANVYSDERNVIDVKGFDKYDGEEIDQLLEVGEYELIKS